ncbi:MAG: single-stranded-DNA-specific exonuclease RecJ [Patescibacteria group bacterium]|nr:single-stranded-DNA-specific exonuclease RecJ [Patescibacteria group bacterium]
MKWIYLSEKIPQNRQELLKILLDNRHIDSNSFFLKPKNPLDFKLSSLKIKAQQIDKAKKRITKAKKNQETVVIFGDYDADGIVASSILWLVFKEIGVKAIPFIPSRDKHGYGISVKALKEVVKKYSPSLIITVDNGIVAHEAAAWLDKKEIDLIITDHHQPDKKKPKAVAVVHSTKICGGAVAWILSRELIGKKAEKYLDLVGIATIADQMKLVEANRSFAYFGIKALQKTKRIGLKAMFEVAKIDQAQTNSFTIGFGLAPRINAVGRLDRGIRAVRLLCTNDSQAAKSIARKLDRINQKRRKLTEEQLALAEELVDHSKKLLFVASDQFHNGIIGLIAGRLTEKYHKPSIAVTTKDKLAKASARSVNGVHITNLIKESEQLLESVGGHELAAGFSVKKENLEDLQNQLAKKAKSIKDTCLEAGLRVEMKLPVNLLDLETVKIIDQLKPFGLGNYPPLFALENLQVVDVFKIGKNKKHLKIALKSLNSDHQFFKAIFWNRGYLADKLKPGEKVDLAASLKINRWQGKVELQLMLKDVSFEQQDSKTDR